MGAIPDDYDHVPANLQGFGKTLTLITPSDTVDLPKRYKCILCGGTGGAVVVRDEAGTEATLYVDAGRVLDGFRPTRIKATGTVATPLYGVDD